MCCEDKYYIQDFCKKCLTHESAEHAREDISRLEVKG